MSPCCTPLLTGLCQDELELSTFLDFLDGGFQSVATEADRRGILARIFSFLCNVFLAALVVILVVPSPYRVIWPEAFGLREVAPRVWTDQAGNAGDLVSLVNGARVRVSGYFGDTPPAPTVILCTTQDCARTFGIGGNGLSMADMVVMVAPGGLTIGTLSHEMTHSRLHREMDLGNLVRQPFPTWFDEGLATHVANHPRGGGRVTQASRARVRQVTRFWELDDAFRALGVGRTYGSAAAEVADMEAKIGRNAFVRMIRRVEAGESFDSVFAGLLL